MTNEAIVKDRVEQVTAEAIYEVTYGDFIGLQTAAKQFLDQIKILSNIYETAINQSRLSDKIARVYKKMETSNNYTKMMLQYQHQFENLLNQFLGKTVYLAYVGAQGEINFYDEAHVGDLYKTAIAQYQGGRGKVFQKNIFDANDLQESLKKDIQKSINIRRPVFLQAQARYYRNEDQAHMKYNPSKNTFYWWKLRNSQIINELEGWTDPITRSRIVEAYVESVINQDENMGGSNHMQISIAALASHIDVDNIPAAIREDVVYDQNGNIQFSVKSADFRTAKIGPYLNLAYSITQIKQILTVEEFKKYLPALIKYTKFTKNVLNVINEKATDKVKEKVEKGLEKIYTKNNYHFFLKI